jgi:hypothetical protein
MIPGDVTDRHPEGPAGAGADRESTYAPETAGTRPVVAGRLDRSKRCIWIREVGIRNRGSPAIASTRKSAAERPAGTGCPSSRTDPDVPAVSPGSIRISVVFPAPSGPR